MLSSSHSIDFFSFFFIKNLISCKYRHKSGDHFASLHYYKDVIVL